MKVIYEICVEWSVVELFEMHHIKNGPILDRPRHWVLKIDFRSRSRSARFARTSRARLILCLPSTCATATRSVSTMPKTSSLLWPTASFRNQTRGNKRCDSPSSSSTNLPLLAHISKSLTETPMTSSHSMTSKKKQRTHNNFP